MIYDFFNAPDWNEYLPVDRLIAGGGGRWAQSAINLGTQTIDQTTTGHRLSALDGADVALA